MDRLEIETMLWHIQREDMQRHGCDQAERDMEPLNWYIFTGRASAMFLRCLKETRPVLVARDLHKGGSYQETLERVFKRIGYQRCDT